MEREHLYLTIAWSLSCLSPLLVITTTVDADDDDDDEEYDPGPSLSPFPSLSPLLTQRMEEELMAVDTMDTKWSFDFARERRLCPEHMHNGVPRSRCVKCTGRLRGGM